ncbi:hypothetical protein M378DRAFT_765576 [Amanita muscaria Koide BX008]|uniref:Uncharacterized protein n=1 Tax=Amanita muscaria (strain Koide BX008) TaxID=946122 RepID=A0A0C2TPH4_AMAMK|nr:hypothetical protein M378DRAFT_765576 [Amanita muscaria Koide BX008]
MLQHAVLLCLRHCHPSIHCCNILSSSFTVATPCRLHPFTVATPCRLHPLLQLNILSTVYLRRCNTHHCCNIPLSSLKFIHRCNTPSSPSAVATEHLVYGLPSPLQHPSHHLIYLHPLLQHSFVSVQTFTAATHRAVATSRHLHPLLQHPFVSVHCCNTPPSFHSSCLHPLLHHPGSCHLHSLLQHPVVSGSLFAVAISHPLL